MSDKNKDFFGDVLPVKDRTGPPADLDGAIKLFVEQWPKMQQFLEWRVKYNRALYDEMIEAGFDKAQAFSFVLAKGI